jgi:hypothetical protein
MSSERVERKAVPESVRHSVIVRAFCLDGFVGVQPDHVVQNGETISGVWIEHRHGIVLEDEKRRRFRV